MPRHTCLDPGARRPPGVPVDMRSSTSSGPAGLYGLVVIGIGIATVACGHPSGGTAGPARPNVVATVAIIPDSMAMATGQSYRLAAALGDAAGNALVARSAVPGLTVGADGRRQPTIGEEDARGGRLVEWRSSDPALVTVDAEGIVRALAPGSATITASSGGRHGTSTVTVVSPPSGAPLAVVPSMVRIPVGERLALAAVVEPTAGEEAAAPVTWSSDQPSRVDVDAQGIATARQPGVAVITATRGGRAARAVLSVVPVTAIRGLDFPGSAGVRSTMRFGFESPLDASPATYIWRAYPRQQSGYYTAFFWGNRDAFYPSHTYYGFHPYPDVVSSGRHAWEIAAPPGGDFLSTDRVVFDRWYVQVAVSTTQGDRTVITFYWDWPDTTKVVTYAGARTDPPPDPALTVGDAPWNPGHEVWNGVLRGFQFYDAALSPSEIATELASPRAVRVPWYLNLDPTPADISDQSGHHHDPTWIGPERPSPWTGSVTPDGVVRTTVPPR